MQVTEKSVNLVEPSGLLEVGSWRPSPSSLTLQHGATAGRLIAVVCETTMFLLEVEMPDNRTISEATRRVVAELRRVDLGSPVSALEMRSLEDTQGGAGERRRVISVPRACIDSRCHMHGGALVDGGGRGRGGGERVAEPRRHHPHLLSFRVLVPDVCARAELLLLCDLAAKVIYLGCSVSDNSRLPSSAPTVFS